MHFPLQIASDDLWMCTREVLLLSVGCFIELSADKNCVALRASARSTLTALAFCRLKFSVDWGICIIAANQPSAAKHSTTLLVSMD